MHKILIVDKVHPSLSETLTEAGWECITDTNMNRESFMSMNGDDLLGLVIRSRFVVDEDMIASKHDLRFIVRIGAGMENIDTEYAKRCGVRVISTPEGNCQSVAELCLGMLLSALRNIPLADYEVRHGRWLREKNKGTEMQSHTYGIIGYGHTGPAFAKILHALGCKVYTYDKDPNVKGDDNAEMISLDELCQNCDVISLHVNYTPDNKYLINDAFIRKVEHPFILINTSRGAVVDTTAMVYHIENGKIRYACLDVLEFESPKLQNLPIEVWPPTMKALSLMSHVILTPHLGGQTICADKRHAEIAFEKIQALHLV